MSDSVIMGANWWIDRLNCRKRLEQCRLPRLRKAMDPFLMGGGFFQLPVPMEIEGMESTFSLRGAHEDVRSLFGLEPGDWTNFFYYERLRDIMRGVNRGRVVRMKGLVSEVEQSQVRGKRADVTNYTISTLVLYHDVTDGRTVHKFDVENNQLIINGVDYSAEANRLIAA